MSPPPSDSAQGSRALQPAEFSFEERSLLLRLAHRAIEGRLANLEVSVTPPTPHLDQKRGAFTTLHLEGALRGCVGYVFPVYSLYRTVAETAVAAAFHDIRFAPVSPEEAPRLKIEISVLSPVRPILAEEIVVGRHGLVITCGMRRGLLLPQVPLEHGWDRVTFLEQTCAKSGSLPDAWRQGATIEAFTAEIFGE
jgi:AmmeMemoRadiSam system protein A